MRSAASATASRSTAGASSVRPRRSSRKSSRSTPTTRPRPSTSSAATCSPLIRRPTTGSASGSWKPNSDGRHQLRTPRFQLPTSNSQPPTPKVHVREQTGQLDPIRIGPFTIQRKLGEGGMGVVYAARDDRLERTIALKMLTAPADDESARERLWREARAAASVNHPNVCQIYEVGEDAGRLFIAMELLEGEPLAERLRRGPLAVPEAMPIALGILAALAALHARGIIHRD